MDKALEAKIKDFMARKLAEKMSLSEIQEAVNAEFSCHLTYMEIRVLASEIPVDWSARDPQPATPPPAVDEPAAPAADEPLEPEAAAAPGGGKTVVELSQIARPGVALSGTVKFASGSTAEWFLDQTGRLGLDKLVGAQPTREDVEGFQRELSRLLDGGR